MTKSTKTLVVVLMAVVLCLSLALVACESAVSISFAGKAQSVEKDGSVTAPDYTPAGEYDVFLGWATSEGKTSSADVLFAKGAKIDYAKIAELAKEGELKLYPVVSTKATIALTIKGVTEEKATLVEGESTAAKMPEVTVGAKQEHIGWATTQNATESQLTADALINYASVKDLASNGAVTLYPVYKTYDLVVGIINVKFDLLDGEENVIHDVNYYVGLVKEDFAAINSTASIMYRIYNGKTAECGAQIIADGDVDVIMAGNNVDATDGANITSVISKAKLISKYNPDGSRRGAIVTNSELAIDLYAMLVGKENKAIEVTIGDTKTVVNQALNNGATIPEIEIPDDTKIIVGYATTENAETPQVVSETITYADVVDLATDGKVTLYPVFGTYDLIVGVVNIKFTNSEDKTKDVNYYVGLVKEDFEKLYPDALVLYRIYDGNVTECGAAITADGDCDVLLAGNNIDGTDSNQGNVTGIIAKAKLVSKYNPDDSRRGALISTDDLSLAMYAMLVGVENDKVEVTVKANAADAGTKTTVGSILGEVADISALVAPTGKTLIGFATTADATEPEISGGILNYASVKALAVDGKIDLFPVYAVPDLVFDILFKSVTVEQIEALIDAFKATADGQGKVIAYRNDFTGSGKNFLSRVKAAGDVDVVLGANNLHEQTGNGIMVKPSAEGEPAVPGAYGAIKYFETTRWIGVIDGCAHQELAIKFVTFAQTAPTTAA